MLQVTDFTHVNHPNTKWVIGGAQLFDSHWIGALRQFSSQLPLVSSDNTSVDQRSLYASYKKKLNSSELGMWTSGSHGAVTSLCWLKPGSLILSTLDGAVISMNQNFMDDASNLKTEPSDTNATKDQVAKVSKVIFRHTCAVHHLLATESSSGSPQLVSSNDHGSIVLLDVLGGKAGIAESNWVHSSTISALCCATIGQSQVVISSSRDGKTKIWDIKSNEIKELEIKESMGTPLLDSVKDFSVSSLGFDSSSNILALGMFNNALLFYDIRNTSKVFASISDSKSIGGAVRSIKHSPTNPNFWATASDDGNASVWDLNSISQSPSSNQSHSKPIYSYKHLDKASSVQWNPEEVENGFASFVSGSWDGIILKHQVKIN